MARFQYSNIGFRNLFCRHAGILVAAVVLAGCSSGFFVLPNRISSVEPETPTIASDEAVQTTSAGSTTIDSIESVESFRLASGVLLIIVGTTRHDGATMSTLVPLNEELPDSNGVLRYEFQIVPLGEASDATEAARNEVTLSHSVSQERLTGASEIEIVSASNTFSVQIPGQRF